MSDAFKTLLKRKRDDTDDEYAPKAAAAKNSKPKAAASVGTCSLNKKDFGDRIKAALRLEKYEAQRMRINVTTDVAFFRSFFGGHASITPADFSPDSPVVVAELRQERFSESIKSRTETG